jgi:hypothetical protein
LEEVRNDLRRKALRRQRRPEDGDAIPRAPFSHTTRLKMLHEATGRRVERAREAVAENRQENDALAQRVQARRRQQEDDRRLEAVVFEDMVRLMQAEAAPAAAPEAAAA